MDPDVGFLTGILIYICIHGDPKIGGSESGSLYRLPNRDPNIGILIYIYIYIVLKEHPSIGFLIRILV